MREKKFSKESLRSVESYNIIDFGQTENNKPDSFQKKIEEICKQEKNYHKKREGNSPII